MNLDNLKEISKLDSQNMLELLCFFPKQCMDALFIGEKTCVEKSYMKNYKNIVFTGLGGSAIGAETTRDLLAGEIKIPIFVNRNYGMPAFVSCETLLFAVSYSGNTEETLSAYEEAIKKRANIIVITSGGKLKELALKHKNMLITIPNGYPPRCALGYSFIPALTVLSKLGLIKNKKDDLKKALTLVDTLGKKSLNPEIKGRANIAKEIAKKIHNRFTVIYASDKFGSVATRWRGQLAENGKTLSSTHVFPEMNHNEIVGWVKPSNILRKFTAIILKDRGDNERVKKRMAITASILKKERFKVIEIESSGKSRLERMLYLIYIGDFVSFYLALLNGIDPTPVDRITYLKKQLVK